MSHPRESSMCDREEHAPWCCWTEHSVGPQGPESESESRSVMSDSLRPHGLYPTRLLCPWNSPGQNIGVGSLSLLQGIFPTQVSCIAGGFFTSSATRDGLAVLEGCYINMYFTFSKWRVLSLYIRSLGNVLVQNIKFILFFLLWCFKNKFLFKKV